MARASPTVGPAAASAMLVLLVTGKLPTPVSANGPLSYCKDLPDLFPLVSLAIAMVGRLASVYVGVR